ncbi:helix-turn-helix domain-containing protein [bacterium]|nr:helix-turn-helix domain-containing protein [bacterium]
MARQALRWNANELANKAGIGTKTIRRIEAEDGPPKSSVTTLEKVRKAFEAAGIEFTGTPEDLPGVRVNLVKKNAINL